jgi:tetratricopeptide (TPR) repeat protein
MAKYSYEAYIISKKTGRNQEADALNHLSFIFSYHSRKTLSMDYAKKAYDLSKKIDYQDGIAEALFNIGYAAGRKDINGTIENYIKAINLAEKIESDYVTALANAYMGDLYSNINNYSEGIKYLMKAQKKFDILLKSDSSVKTLYYYGEMINSLGITYKRSGNFVEAEQYYLKYLDISKRLNNEYGIGIAFNNLGVIYTRNKEYQKAIKNFDESIDVFKKIGMNYYLGTIYNNLGSIYSDLLDNARSEEQYNVALGYYQQFGDSVGMSLVLANLADLKFVKKEFKKSKELYNQAIDFLNSQDIEILINCYEGLSIVYDSLNNMPEAYNYFKLYSALKDSMVKINKTEEIGMITENYKSERMIDEQKRIVEENIRLDNERLNRKYNLQYIAIFVLILFVFAFIIFYGKIRITSTKLESIVFVALLFLFEFIMVFFDPYVNGITKGEPIFNLLINAVIALSLTPLDTFMEKIIRQKKNVSV